MTSDSVALDVYLSHPAHHPNNIWGIIMPKQIHDVEKFLEMTEDAEECRVKRASGNVKLKLRTTRYLYTIVLEPQKAEEVLQQVKCQIVEARAVSSED
jgi:hypothetical protein